MTLPGAYLDRGLALVVEALARLGSGALSALPAGPLRRLTPARLGSVLLLLALLVLGVVGLALTAGPSGPLLPRSMGRAARRGRPGACGGHRPARAAAAGGADSPRTPSQESHRGAAWGEPVLLLDGVAEVPQKKPLLLDPEPILELREELPVGVFPGRLFHHVEFLGPHILVTT